VFRPHVHEYQTKQINNQTYKSGKYKSDSFRNEEESGEVLTEISSGNNQHNIPRETSTFTYGAMHMKQCLGEKQN
jgi:hypothetical protein